MESLTGLLWPLSVHFCNGFTYWLDFSIDLAYSDRFSVHFCNETTYWLHFCNERGYSDRFLYTFVMNWVTDYTFVMKWTTDFAFCTLL